MPKDIDKPQTAPEQTSKPIGESPEKEENFDSKKFTYAEREHKDRTESEKIVIEKLMEEVKVLEANEATRGEASQKAKQIQALHEDEKLKHLLDIAKTKGVVEAIHVAEKTNEPYLLDLLHDILAREGYYKKFTK